MNKEELQQVMKEYIKENLSLAVRTEKQYVSYGGCASIKVTVKLSVEGEDIAEEYDYMSLR